MKVSVLYFALYRETSGKNREVIDVVNEIRVKDFEKLIRKKYPELKDTNQLLFAVNKNHVSPDYVIKENDEVAVFPPISGG